MKNKTKLVGTFNCPKCDHVVAVYMKKKMIREPIKGEYETEFEFR